MPKTEDQLRDRLTVAEAAVLSNVSQLRVLAAAVEATDRLQGCSTPAEEFACAVLRSYGDGSLSPEDVEDSLKEFKGNLRMMAPAARNFAKRFPDLMVEKEEVETNA